jgi:excisionase family DNA binding protein
MTAVHFSDTYQDHLPAQETLLTFKEAMAWLSVSRSTLYRLMWSGQLTGRKVGCTWRFYTSDLRACVQRATPAAQEGEKH